MNSKLQEAVAIFKALGWEKANRNNVLALPIGTAEQKKTALEGLKSGEWREWRETNDGIGLTTIKRFWVIDVNPLVLTAFAIRVGIDAQRAVSVLPWPGDDSEELGMLEAVITARGETYANRFILSACVDRYRVFMNAPSRYGKLVVALVHNIPLRVPQNAGYIKDWIAGCAPNQHAPELRDRQITDAELWKKIRQRFTEHVQTAVEIGAPVSEEMEDLLQWGIAEKCISKEALCGFAFTALNTPIRPGDRKAWLEILDFLQVSDEELCLHMEELLPVLSMGEAPVINRLAPVYIAHADDNMLVPLLMACFSCKVGKTRRIVLEAALRRNRPPQAEQLTDWLSLLCTEADAKTVKLAEKLNAQWMLGTISLPEETDVHGCWQPTPPLWTVPAFSLGETTPEALTQLAAQIMGQAAIAHDITTERFLAVANMVAYRNPEEARLSLQGLRNFYERIDTLLYVRRWVKKESFEFGMDIEGEIPRGILSARDYVAAAHLGEQPCLLSTPSRDDLSVRADDLLARLKAYQKSGAKAQEADLYLAMTRLIPEQLSAKKTAEWQSVDVAVLLQNGKTMPVTAGHAVLEWLTNPQQEPALALHDKSYWRRADKLRDPPEFPPRLGKRNYWVGDELPAIFPLWGDAALMETVRWDYEVNHQQGLDLRQAARHSTPFSADVMLNFLAAQRSILAQDAAEDSRLAVMEAWQRGLLRPGAADIKKFDWSTCTPDHLAAFAAYLDEIAQQGLLSLVWSVTDSLILASCQAPRMFSGTAELAELIRRYLPAAQAAVKAGIADADVLNLPGTRMLAARKGSSAAVCAAKAAVGQLPPVSQTAPPAEIRRDTVLDPPFATIWPKPDAPCVVPDDGASVEVHPLHSRFQSRKFLYFVIALPEQPDCVYQSAPGDWAYGLESEGQCSAYKTKPGAPWPGKNGEPVWLHWDADAQKTVVCADRDWRQKKDGPLRNARTALPFSLIVVAIGMQGQSNWCYSALRLLNELIAQRELDAAIMKRAMQMLLKSPELSPALLVRAPEEDVSLLPLMWPVLTESVRAAGQQTAQTGKPPVWVNRILDVCIRYAPYLRQAAETGYIPKKDAEWEGLPVIAGCKAKSAAVAKAKQAAALLKEGKANGRICRQL